MKNRTVGSILLAILLATFVATPVLAKEVKGVEVPAEVVVDGHNLKLNGVGVRSKFFVSVYVGSLYLTNPTSDAKAAIDADEAKRIDMNMLRDVAIKKMVGAYKEGFEENTPKPDADLKARIDKFLALYKDEAKEGQLLRLTYIPGKGTEAVQGDKVLGVVEGADFMRACWRIWLGDEPADGSLKKKMLAP
jgi:hypothetical protein